MLRYNYKQHLNKAVSIQNNACKSLFWSKCQRKCYLFYRKIAKISQICWVWRDKTRSSVENEKRVCWHRSQEMSGDGEKKGKMKKIRMMSQISQAPPPNRQYDLNNLSHVTCISLITQSTQHYKGTHPTPALCLISIIRSGLSTATTYLILTCSETYLLFLLLVGSCVFLVCQRAAIDLGCVLLLVIHEFLARQVPSVYPLLSRQTTKSHTHHFRITSASTITTSSPSMIASPMAKPTPFSGVAEECNGFLLQCSLYIEMCIE